MILMRKNCENGDETLLLVNISTKRQLKKFEPKEVNF